MPLRTAAVGVGPSLARPAMEPLKSLDDGDIDDIALVRRVARQLGVDAAALEGDVLRGGRRARGPRVSVALQQATLVLKCAVRRVDHGGFVASVAFSRMGSGRRRWREQADRARRRHRRGEARVRARWRCQFRRVLAGWKWLAAGDAANKLIVRDADTGAEKHAFEHGGCVFSVAFSPDGKWLAAGDGANKLIVRDADTGAEKHAFEHGDFVRSVAFSPTGKGRRR